MRAIGISRQEMGSIMNVQDDRDRRYRTYGCSHGKQQG